MIEGLIYESFVLQTNDINGYPKAPPSFRICGGGGTVEPDDVSALLPWIDWVYRETKINLD